MPTSINPSLRAAIERLKHAGSISGVGLGWRRQVLLNMTPYEDYRLERVLGTLGDAREHFRSSDREVDTFWFGFDGVFVLALSFKDCTLVLLHTRAHEVDFLKSAALTLLDDCQLLVTALLNPSEGPDGGDTQPLGEGHQETHVIPRS